MLTSDFAFIPRKLAKSSRNAGGTTRPQEALTRQAEVASAPAASSSSLTQEQKKSVKYLEDSAYTTLFELALSEYALWTNHELLEVLEANEEGYIPISYLIRVSPVFAGLSDVPAETVLVRCARASSVIECRLIVSEPSSSARFSKSGRSGANSEGGFEIRRKDWANVRGRVRQHTSFHWDSRTVYVENLPYHSRALYAVHDFISQLLPSREACKSDTLPIQSISFPRHQKDDPEGPAPTVGKGFAFIVLSSVKDVDYLLERWPWDLCSRSARSKEGEPSKVVQEAAQHGFRCLSKRKWDELKEGYLALQRRLLEKTLAANNAGPTMPRLSQRKVCEGQTPREENGRSSSHGVPQGDARSSQKDELPPWYPKDCLVFVKNVHPETNKTTLRNLFSSAFNKETSFIDYVDYNKGLDSCYLRLSDPSSARTLVTFFSERRITQKNALDGEGVSAIPNSNSPVEAELVQGKKAELYWEKVPEKIRKAAIAKSQPNVVHDTLAQGKGAIDSSSRKRKRRKGD